MINLEIISTPYTQEWGSIKNSRINKVELSNGNENIWNKILNALRKALEKERSKFAKVNSIIEQYNQRHQDLPKLLVDQTEKKKEMNKLLGDM